MTTTPIAPPALMFSEVDLRYTDSIRLGWIRSAIRNLDHDQTRTALLHRIDECEAEIIKASHHHGVELDQTSRDAMLRLLSEGTLAEGDANVRQCTKCTYLGDASFLPGTGQFRCPDCRFTWDA